ncbi:MAG: TatD family hydrolase [Nanoarchaeota archaeon]
MFDFHCHFFNNENVKWFILNNGLNPETNRKVLNLDKKNYFKALGIHPTEVLKLTEDKIENELYFIEEKLKNKEIHAIGEVGLDYYWNKDPKIISFQKELFERFIDLAEKYKVPLVVHSREAEEDIVDLITTMSETFPVVLHSFNYSRLDLVEDLLDYNTYFTVSFTYSKKFNYFVEKLPIEKILIESDYPYKSHGKTLELVKKFLPKTIEKIAEIKKIEKKEAEKIIDKNSFEVLNIKNQKLKFEKEKGK